LVCSRAHLIFSYVGYLESKIREKQFKKNKRPNTFESRFLNHTILWWYQNSIWKLIKLKKNYVHRSYQRENEQFPLILGFLILWSNFDCLSWYIFSFFHCLFWSNFDCCVWMCTFQKSCVDISDKIKTFAIFFSSKHLSGSPDPTTNSETRIFMNHWTKLKQLLQVWSVFFFLSLTLIGMREDTFHSLSFLNQILSAEFLSKISKLFCRWKLTSIGLIWHPTKLIESYKKCPYVALKMSIFLAFIAHANEG